MAKVTFADSDPLVSTEEEDEEDVSHEGIDTSQRSGGESIGSSSGSRSKSASLRGNLTRQHAGRDPMAYYEVVQLLGAGSMGSVSKVKKKSTVIGGSARFNMAKRNEVHGKLQTCFSLPLVGGFFQNCLKGHANALTEKATLQDTVSTLTEDGTSHHRRASTQSEFSSAASWIFAMKSIHLNYIKDKTMVEELKNEVEMLKSLDHPHIVRVIETFDYRNQLFVVMELCSGGDLYSRDPYTEDQAARISSSILSAVAYMHSKGVLHRDLKYENILFIDDTPRAAVKLIDFGLSAQFEREKEITESAGTVYTMAPEVIRGKYTEQADMWSVGVIAFMLMSSQLPFFGETRREIVNKILAGKYEFKGRRWKRISGQGKAFIEDLLVMDPDDRATADEALRSSWLHRRNTETVRNPHQEELESVKKSITRFANYSRLRKVALMVVAHRSTSQEIGILRKVFEQYTKGKTGTINYQEFKSALHDVGYTDADYHDIFDAIDLDGSGLIRYTEFLAAAIEATGPISEERLAEAFDRVDHDDSGYISAGNLKYMLGPDYPDEEIEAIINESASRSKKHGITYAEFLAEFENDHDHVARHGMIQEVTVIGDGNNHHANDDSHIIRRNRTDSQESQVSNLTDVDDIASSKFREEKIMSERKAAEYTEPQTPEEREMLSKVVFQQQVQVS